VIRNAPCRAFFFGKRKIDVIVQTTGVINVIEMTPATAGIELRKTPWNDKFSGRWGERWENENILSLNEEDYPKFTLAKNKARFLRMVGWYKQKHEWLEVAPISGVSKLFKQQTKELESIRASKMDYEMELEMGTLTPSQQSYRRDELKMCEVHERMAVSLISRMQMKIKSGRR